MFKIGKFVICTQSEIDRYNSQLRYITALYRHAEYNLNQAYKINKSIYSADIDFPNSKKGGTDDPETPINFPDIF